MDSIVAPRTRRRIALVFGAVLCVLVAYPLLWGQNHDSFPLSNYTMFAWDQGRQSVLDTVIVRTSDGMAHRLGSPTIAGSDETMLAAATVADAVAGGDQRTAELCRYVATRIDRDDVAAYGPGAQVQVVTETWDAVGWFRGHHNPLSTAVHASCPLGAG